MLRLLTLWLQGRFGDMDNMKIRGHQYGGAAGSFSAFVTGAGTRHWNPPEFFQQQTLEGRVAVMSTKGADVHGLGAMAWAMLLGANLRPSTSGPGLDYYWPVRGGP
jgi:hypothetical protein